MLREKRTDELEQLEQDIIELQLLLALHINELIKQRDIAGNSYTNTTPRFNQAVDNWNASTNQTSCDTAFESYACCLTETFLLNIISNKNNEIEIVINYYTDNKKTTLVLKQSTNLVECIAYQKERCKEINCWVMQEKKRVAQNTTDIEKYFKENNIQTQNSSLISKVFLKKSICSSMR